MTTEGRLAHPECLLTQLGFRSARGDPRVVIVDVDSEAGYARGHIAGSVMIPSDYERDPNTGWVRALPPDKFAALCQNLGIGDETQVIIYDNNLSLYAARLWWVLNHYGHSNT